MTVSLRLAILATCATLAFAAPVLAAPEKAAKPTTGKAQAKQPSGQRVGIATVVNDDVITFSDIEDRMRLYMLGAPPNLPPEAKQKVLQQAVYRLVDEKLQLQEAKALNIAPTDKEIEDGFAMLAAQNKVTPERFREGLQKSGINLNTIHEQIRAELAWTQVVRRKLRPQIVISENEIDTEVDRLQRSSGRTEYRIAEIFLSFDGDASEKNAREQMERLSSEISKGRPFSQVAREYSEAPGAATGGDLGWIEEGILAPELDAAVAGLQPGQLSAPIRTTKGYHLLFLRDVRQKGLPGGNAAAPAAAPAEESPAAADVAAPATSEKRPSLIATDAPAPELPKLSAAANVKRIMLPLSTGEAEVLVQSKLARAEQLRREITSCDAMDARMKDFSATGTGDLGRIDTTALPDAAKAALDGVNDGSLSRPARVDGGIALYMVCGRDAAPAPKVIDMVEAPATAPEKPAAAPAANNAASGANEMQREEIANRLGSQRLEQMAERYLRDLRATAFIEQRF